MAAEGLGVTYFNYLQRRLETLESEKKEYKDKKEQKEEEIKHLHNGFREDVHNRLIDLERDIEVIKEAILGDKLARIWFNG